jgi:hypothetical protein
MAHGPKHVNILMNFNNKWQFQQFQYHLKLWERKYKEKCLIGIPSIYLSVTNVFVQDQTLLHN